MTAQTDSLVQLPTVEIHATSLRHDQPGSMTESWQISPLATLPVQSVADFLRSKTGIYLKTYGAGSLATTSIRGASAGQTAVLWNGFQIQSPMLGLLDWSLLPTAFVDDISLQHGGNGAVWGSGAIGGALLMDNRPDFSTKPRIQFGRSLGSFGNWSDQLAVKIANDRWASATRFFHQQAENDFSYQPAPGLASKRQTNAAVQQRGLMQEVYFRPNSQHQLGGQIWLQAANREIPPTIVQARSVANQQDEAIRTALHWRFARKEQVVQVRTALFRESIHYRDALAGVNTPSRFWTSITEADLQRPILPKISLQITGNQTFTKAFIKNYERPGRRWQSALFASLRYENGPWSAQLDSRQEWANGRAVPFTPAFSAERRFGHRLSIGAKLNRNYRLPTLNDLFWSPGGNPDLQPELGWSEELNARFTLKKNKAKLELTSAVFNRNIENWIQWLPTTGQPFWSASNIKAVHSRGIENRLNLDFTHRNWQFHWSGGYDYVRSTNREAVALPKIEAGQQWFYVPEHQGFVSGSVHFKGLGLEYRQQFTGSVVTEFGRLAGFRVAAAQLHYEARIAGNGFRFFLQLDNAWDANYQIIERRPMPGRTWLVGVSVSLNN